MCLHCLTHTPLCFVGICTHSPTLFLHFHTPLQYIVTITVRGSFPWIEVIDGNGQNEMLHSTRIESCRFKVRVASTEGPTAEGDTGETEEGPSRHRRRAGGFDGGVGRFAVVFTPRSGAEPLPFRVHLRESQRARIRAEAARGRVRRREGGRRGRRRRIRHHTSGKCPLLFCSQQ